MAAKSKSSIHGVLTNYYLHVEKLDFDASYAKPEAAGSAFEALDRVNRAAAFKRRNDPAVKQEIARLNMQWKNHQLNTFNDAKAPDAAKPQ